MRDDGYVPVEQVLATLVKNRVPGITLSRILREVDNCPKRRFEVTPCRTFIRASRGHSIRHLNDAQMLTEITDASTVHGAVYGTSSTLWPGIRETGIRRGAKNHIHIATRDSTHGYVIGVANSNANVLVYIDVAAAMANGILFYLVDNGVVLTRGVQRVHHTTTEDYVLPATYFTRAVLHNADGTVTELELSL